MTLNETERQTIVAALQNWNRAPRLPEALIEIATNDGEHELMAGLDVDALVTRLQRKRSRFFFDNAAVSQILAALRLAQNHALETPLSIDALCEKINFGG